MERDVAVLVVDDDESSREFEREALAMAGYQVRTAASGGEALAMLSGGAFDAVLLDVRMPGMDGLELLESYRGSGGRVPMIVLSAMAGSDDIVKAMRLGATDYLTKPVDPSDLLASMARAFGRQPALAPAAAPPRRQEVDEPPEERTFIAHSAAMLRVKRLVERIADTDVPVLLLGESGVGKEVIAREIHTRSRRHAKPFLKINCAALPSELLESELF
ncbi:MAG TPA: sigma-54-dependent Fis family transcriptional regulator, partial [Myxococcales bacterium]|nr:sigma-54-dependent Fis family transcriptional regulator [Myxococcales bacterium]